MKATLITGWEDVNATLTDVVYDYTARATILTFSSDQMELIGWDVDLLKERLRVVALDPIFVWQSRLVTHNYYRSRYGGVLPGDQSIVTNTDILYFDPFTGDLEGAIGGSSLPGGDVVAECIEKKDHHVKPRIEVIALERCDLNERRVRLVASTRVIEIIVVVGYTKFCSLGQVALINRLILDKRKGFNLVPGGLRYFPIEYDRPGQSLYSDGDLRVSLFEILCRRRN